MEFKNIKVYGLEDSMIKSGYPMQIGEPLEITDDIKFEMFHSPELPANNKTIQRAKKLAKTPVGSGHNNFLKGIIVQFDMQYPEYFSPQLQRYHWIDIVSSQSKMHKLTSRLLQLEDFTKDTHIKQIEYVNQLIYDKKPFEQIISNLPSGYLKWMGISTNYLQLKTIYHQRCKHKHKLKEWSEFGNFIITLPMSELITEVYDT